ncbi:MAG: serine hydrolase [Sphingopyxis terrae]|nr:MAG: serine hydrolase [Sphingopyxis terrae]
MIDDPSAALTASIHATASRRSFLAGALSTVALAPPALARSPAAENLDRFLADQRRSGGMAGLAVGLARSGKVLLSRTCGHADIAMRRPVTVASMFHLASVTKTITATGIMMLAEEGRLDIDAPVNRYLDFAVVSPAAPGQDITARHLLMHMSGISDATYYAVDFRTHGGDSPLALGDFLRSYLVPGGTHYSATGSFSGAPPGRAYDYSNVGYGLLGYIGTRVAGVDFRTYLQRRLFSPLGMDHLPWTLADVPAGLRVTPYEIDAQRLVPVAPVGFPDWPAGMLRASISGLMPFVAASANHGRTGSCRMLAETSMDEMLHMQKPPGLPAWLTGQGLGWMESEGEGAPRINHWGGDPGVFTAVYLDPATTTGIAILTNGSATAPSKAAIKTIARKLFTLGNALS